MANLVELFGLGWGALAGLIISLLALQARRTRRHATSVQTDAPTPPKIASWDSDAPFATFDSRELDVEHEVSEVLAQLRGIARRLHVSFEVTVQPKLTVWADPCALRQMLAGVLAQATERACGGAVLVSAGWHGGRVQVTVMDDGPAGDYAVLAGMLRQVEQCAALQGGTLEIECRLPRGNRIVLRLPGTGAPDEPMLDDDAFDEPALRTAPWTRVEGAS